MNKLTVAVAFLATTAFPLVASASVVTVPELDSGLAGQVGLLLTSGMFILGAAKSKLSKKR